MKMQIVIIISLFICSLSFEEWLDITAGVPLKISDLEKGDIYTFSIESSEYSKLNFSFTLSNIYKNPFSYIELAEVNSYNDLIYKSDWKNLTFSTKEINSNLIISASHIVSEYEIIFISINLTSNIKEMIIKVDEEIGAYELNNDSKKINCLLSDFSYYFYRKASKDLKINFNLTMDYLDSEPIKNLFIYEVKDWGISKDIENTSQSIAPIKKGNQLLISFSYIVSHINYDFVGIIVKPAQNLYNVEIKIDLLAEFYNLENRKPITVQNLIPEKYYFFFINVEMDTKAEFIINMDKINDEPFNNTGIIRYKRSDISFNKYSRLEPYEYNKTIKENKLEISFLYSVSKYETQKIALILQPLSKIDYINIKVNDEGGFYELTDGSRNSSNLKANVSYYFYTSDLLDNTLNISLTMKSSSSAPFSSITIYEGKEKRLVNLEKTTLPASLKQIDNMLFTSFSYSTSIYYYKYKFIEIRPSSFIDSITIKIEQNAEFYNLKINTPKTFYNLTSEKIYYFNMKIERYSKVYINITLDKKDDNPFNFSNLYETSNALSFSGFSKANKYNNFSQIIDNKTIIAIIYKSTISNDRFISYGIKPLYDLDSINVNTFELKSSFEIIDGVSQNITNLVANNTYYLTYNDNQKFLKYDFYLSMNYMEEKPFDYLYVYDGQATRLIQLKNDIKKIDNEWVIIFQYESPHQLSPGFMYYYITPKKNIEYLFIRVAIYSYSSRIEFDAESDKIKLCVNSGVLYHMVIKSQYNKTVLLNFIMDDIYNNAFSSLIIYEYNDLINPYYNKKTTLELKDKQEGNKIEIPISYKVTNTSTNYTFIDFIPKKVVHKLIINLNVTNTTYESNESDKDKNSNDNNFNAYYIIIPIIIIIAIILIIFIIIFIKRKNKISSDIIENNGQQPLFSTQEKN